MLCLEIRETGSLYVHIYIFCAVVSKDFFAHGPLEYKLFLNKSGP